MTTVPDYVEAVRHQQRAARHAVSLTLLMHGLAMAGLAVVNRWHSWLPTLLEVLVPSFVYVTLWLVLRVRQQLTGIGTGRGGFGALALVSVLLVIPLVSVTVVAVVYVGAAAFLGVGLLVIGVRLKEARLWGPGIAMVALCPFVGLSTFDNHARFLGSQPGTVVLSVLAVMLLALSGSSYLAERAELAEPQLP